MEQQKFIQKYLPLFFGSVVILILDQYSKYLIRTNLNLYDSISVIKGFFNLTFIENSGAAFSFLSNESSPWVWRFFVIVTLIAMVIITALYREVEGENEVLKYSLILMLGGAIGNFVDRLFLGKVTDFLDFHIMGHHWPAFNIADSCITIGVAVIISTWVFSAIKEKKGR